MSNCKNCKYWDRNDTDPQRDNTENVKLCTKTVFLDDARQFYKNEEDGKAVYSYKISEQYKNQKMFTIDGSGYRADFLTRDFYCNHFEVV